MMLYGRDNDTQVVQREYDPLRGYREAMVPWLMGQAKQASAPGPGLNFFTRAIGGGGFRPVSENPVWSEAQIQQRVNAGRALTDAQRDTSIRRSQTNLANRGFATRTSPLAMQLAEQQRGMAMMANAANENNLRWAAAQGNAEHVQKAQVANQQAWNDYLEAQGRNRVAALSAWQGDRASRAGEAQPFLNSLMQLLGITKPTLETVRQMQSQTPNVKGIGPDLNFLTFPNNRVSVI